MARQTAADGGGQRKLRLIRYEMALMLALLDRPDLTAEDVRSGIERNVIKDDQWQAGQTLLSEALTYEEWLLLASPYLGTQLLLGHPGEDDEALLKTAERVVEGVKKATSIVWRHDETS